MAELNLRWNDHPSNLMSGFSSVYNSNRLCDVIVSCGDQDFQSHKLILCFCSNYFADLFDRNPQLDCPGFKTVVFIKDVEAHIMQLLLNYMYCGQVTVQEAELPAFLAAAKALKIKGTIPACLEVSEARENNSNIANDCDQEDFLDAISGVSPDSAVPRSSKRTKTPFQVRIGKRPKRSVATKRVKVEQDETLDSLDESNNQAPAPAVANNSDETMGDIDESEQGHDENRDDSAHMYFEETDNTDYVGKTAPFTTIQGKFEGSLLYICDGHMFIINGETKDRNRAKVNLRCRQSVDGIKCTGLAYINNETKLLTKTRAHTCNDDETEVSIMIAKDEMRKLCKSTSRSLRDIFQSAVAQTPALGYRLTFEKYANTMRRWRNKALDTLMEERNDN